MFSPSLQPLLLLTNNLLFQLLRLTLFRPFYNTLKLHYSSPFTQYIKRSTMPFFSMKAIVLEPLSIISPLSLDRTQLSLVNGKIIF
jgi:hypothetical protein